MFSVFLRPAFLLEAYAKHLLRFGSRTPMLKITAYNATTKSRRRDHVARRILNANYSIV